jgi:25S rRNA (adenine(2142)-N(1))-methyltransferase, Bmt2
MLDFFALTLIPFSSLTLIFRDVFLSFAILRPGPFTYTIFLTFFNHHHKVGCCILEYRAVECHHVCTCFLDCLRDQDRSLVVTGMRRPRKKRLPVTTASSVNAGSSNPRSGRRLIRQFHVLLKRRAALLGASTAAANDDQSLAETERKIESLGGLSAYQKMSTIGQGRDRGGGSEKRLIAWLRDMGFADRIHGPTRLVPKLRYAHTIRIIVLTD